ncbi:MULTISPECIES: putative leader peptide [Kitasatospora]|uniref:Uncharacterized protein n=1 Tax=Kitasatospora cystarginea TaxID=58350 RepID=A0ABP5QSV2_9ACTN
MRSVDVSNQAPGIRLVARLHIDLCRLASSICPPAAEPLIDTTADAS